MFPNYCASETNVDIHTTEHQAGNANVVACESACNLMSECSAVEWYAIESKCYLLLSPEPATKGSSDARYKDAACYIKPGNVPKMSLRS